MKHSKLKVSVIVTLVLCLALSFAMPVLSSANDYSDDVITDIEGIIAYVKDSTSSKVSPSKTSLVTDVAKSDSVWDKNLETALTGLITDYKTSPSDDTLKDIATYLNAWVSGGHDADKIFFTDKLFGYIVDFAEIIEDNDIKSASDATKLAFTWPMGELKDEDENPTGEYAYTFAKRFVSTTDTFKSFWANSKVEDAKGENQLFNHFSAVDSSLYVAGRNAAAVESKMIETRTAMENAATAKEAYEALTAFFDYINKDGHVVLRTGSELYGLAAKLLYIYENITDGDSTAFEDIEAYAEFIEEELYDGVDSDGLRRYPLSGIVQYRPAGQVTSFIDDSNTMNAEFEQLIEELNDVIDAYAETVDDFDAKIAGFTYTDPYAPIENSDNGSNNGNNGGNGNNGNGSEGNKGPENTADAMTAVLSVSALLSAGAVVLSVKAKRNYNR